jgi:hypothetical protein
MELGEDAGEVEARFHDCFVLGVGAWGNEPCHVGDRSCVRDAGATHGNRNDLHFRARLVVSEGIVEGGVFSA